jgi:hypothetical protein
LMSCAAGTLQFFQHASLPCRSPTPLITAVAGPLFPTCNPVRCGRLFWLSPTVFHLVCGCSSPALTEWRLDFLPNARSVLMRIVRCLETAHGEVGCDISRRGGDVVSEATYLDFHDDASRFILFRLLMCLPWSARAASDDIAFCTCTVSVTRALFDLRGLEKSLLSGDTGAFFGVGALVMPCARHLLTVSALLR